jgi:prepilin-type N-terminal cleavage/methylation domain-containing protein
MKEGPRSHMKQKPRSGNKGFTLIELLIVMFILAMVMGVILYIYTTITSFYSEQISTSEGLHSASNAIQRIENEIINSRQVLIAGSNQVKIWNEDTNNNGTFESGETTSYSWNGVTGGDIIRATTTNYILCKGVKNFSLIYNSGILANITLVQIKITVGDTILSTVESYARLRNAR